MKKLFVMATLTLAFSSAFATQSLILSPGSSTLVQAGVDTQVTCNGTNESANLGYDCTIVKPFQGDSRIVYVNNEIYQAVNSYRSAVNLLAQLKGEGICK